ncbi:MAG: hypothetical protein IPL46_19455 [Saprospiraceae bacterium]|nr:hypothetical protein [Saprospiraceae bacterium]
MASWVGLTLVNGDVKILLELRFFTTFNWSVTNPSLVNSKKLGSYKSKRQVTDNKKQELKFKIIDMKTKLNFEKTISNLLFLLLVLTATYGLVAQEKPSELDTAKIQRLYYIFPNIMTLQE